MDDQLITFSGDEHDDFEEIRGAIRADDEPSVRVLAKVIDNTIECSIAWSMSSSATPWRRADGWISTEKYCTTKVVYVSFRRREIGLRPQQPAHTQRSPEAYRVREQGHRRRRDRRRLSCMHHQVGDVLTGRRSYDRVDLKIQAAVPAGWQQAINDRLVRLDLSVEFIAEGRGWAEFDAAGYEAQLGCRSRSSNVTSPELAWTPASRGSDPRHGAAKAAAGDA